MKRILIIDDNRSIHADFRKILCAAPASAATLDATEQALFGRLPDVSRPVQFEVDSAYQGQEGLVLVKQALAAGRPYALAFVDVRMPPGWDGVETTRNIWEVDPDLQVVLCTAYSDYSWGELFARLGQRDGLLILKKPFDAVEAFQLAHALTEKWRLHQQARQKMAGLEQRVAERTRELELANQALQAEVVEHQRAEKALQWKTAFLEAQVNSSIDGILVVDQAGKLSLQNQRFVDLFKLPQPIADEQADEHRLRWVTGMVKHPEQFAEKVAYLYGHPKETGRDEIELKDGTVLDRYSSPVVGHDGQHYGRIWTFRDITEGKLTQEVLRESEARFAGAFEHAPIGVALVSPAGRWLKVNRALCDLVGYSEAELLTRSFQDITHPADLDADLEYVRRMIAGEIRSYQLEKRYVHARGHHISALLNVSLVRDSRGQPGYFISQIQDITERKRAEVALVETSALLETLLQNTADGIYFKDLQSRFVHFSRRMLDFFHLAQPDELKGKTDFDFFFEEHARAAFEVEQKIIRTGETIVNLEEEENHRDGRITWVLTSKMRWCDPAGKVIGTMGISRDITERKRLEAQLFQSLKMETVGKLAGGVAHEFNSLLTVIIGQGEMLRNDLSPWDPMGKNAEIILQAAERAATLTRQLLAYGRQQMLQPKILDLNAILTGMESTLRHLLAGSGGAALCLSPAAGLKGVLADAEQMELVITNLAMNAAEAMPHGGLLTLTTVNLSLDQEYVRAVPELKAGDYVMLAITDTGTGMSGEAKAHVFEPFFTTKRVGQGTGLGLSTCYGIIKQSGGHISVDTEPGRGTTFKIYLPQVEAQPQPPTPLPDSVDLPRGTETILLVEDDRALRELVASLLRRLGYTVLAAAHGLEALSLKHPDGSGRIDLLFTDLVMPHLSGLELSERVRALCPQVRILFASGRNEQATVPQGAARLQKPYTPSALARKLREVLDQPDAPQPDIAPSANEFPIALANKLK